jgi:hypothetical protein
MGTLKNHVSSARRKGIYREAILLDKQGWLVLANHIPGYCTPPEIEGYIPDIYALKELSTYIMMIECQFDSNPICTTILKAYADSFNQTIFQSMHCEMEQGVVWLCTEK